MRAPVSWLIPVRDGTRWLGDALRSALAESKPQDEILVIDDGSRDDPASVLPADRRLRLIRQEPLGIALALERGRSEARYAFLARLDADDIALPGRIDAQVALLEAEPDLVAVGGRARIHRDGAPVPQGMDHYVSWVNALSDGRPLRPSLLVESPLFHPATTLRAQALSAVGGWRQGDFPEDYDLWLRLAGAGFQLRGLPRDVLQLRDREDRLTRSDPRYRPHAFERLKRDFIETHLLRPGMRVVLWGGGRTGRRWLRWLLEQKVEVVAVIDLVPGGSRLGVPVLPIEALRALSLDLLLVAVAMRGVREIIAGEIRRLRPELVEGQHWWSLA